MRKWLSCAAWAVAVVFVVQTAAEAQWTWTPQTKRWINVKRMPKETDELQIEYARGLLVKGDYRKAYQETDKFIDYYAGSPLSDQNQFLRGEIRLAQEEYVDAAKEFQQVVTAYPASALYDAVIAKQYEIGDKLYESGLERKGKRFRPFKKKPFKQAIEVYRMVIANQPFTLAAAEAQYKVGLCHVMRKEYAEAAYEYRRVIEDYSGSEWVDDASYGLAMAYYEQSLPAAYDQAPSQLAIGAIDDFKQRFPVDARVEDLSGKRAEMRNVIAKQRLETARFYEKRRKFEAARLSYQVVVDQFSETPFAREAQEWLARHSTEGVSSSS
ncbi:MAG TPA: outer membrane protein assembly factor BamD [Candidatus Hydrogenedentes bacterium]|nr:outer membrane protein assembly factor BamD [Candidatus Hydrogenedentota bacterium]HOS03515.1 outer membrane protein assembly factor BamD [Candidatus Hydrogenedentota bacterium]